VEVEFARYEFFLRRKKAQDLRQGGASELAIYKQVKQMQAEFDYGEFDDLGGWT